MALTVLKISIHIQPVMPSCSKHLYMRRNFLLLDVKDLLKLKYKFLYSYNKVLC